MAHCLVSICCSSVFVIIRHPAWFAALPLAWTFVASLTTASQPHQPHSASYPCYHFIGSLYICLTFSSSDLLIGRTYKYVLARHLRSLPRVIPSIYLHVTHRCITTQLYTPFCNTSFTTTSPTCGILVDTFEKPLEIVWVDTRSDSMSEIRNPPLWGAIPHTKRRTHVTHAVLNCLASTI